MIVIILDGHLQSALAAVRSLGQKKIKVLCGADRPTAMSLYSRYCDDTFIYTSPLVDKAKFLVDIQNFVSKQTEKCVVFACSDSTFLPLSRSREQLQNIHLVLAHQSQVEMAFDKKKTLELALKVGVPIPPSYFPQSLEELKELAPSLVYPIVLKPGHSVSWVGNKGVSATASFVVSAEDLVEKAQALFVATQEVPFMQEVIFGEEYGVLALCEKGKVQTVFAHHRLRSIHPYGGASSVRESVPLPEPMATYARTLLEALSWHGVAMVEFKKDEISGIPYLMEINGRFWGSLPLAVFAGINFPYLQYQLAAYGQAEVVKRYVSFIVARHLLADVKRVLNIFTHKGKISGRPFPRKFDVLIDFFSLFGKKIYYDVESVKDIKPFFMELVDAFVKTII